MKISLKNIGGLKSAEVEINGLTIIAGENDSGKSTVGKAIFAIVKAVSRYEHDFKEDRYESVANLVEDFYIKVRKTFNLNKNKELKAAFTPDSVMYELNSFFAAQQLFDNYTIKTEYDVKDFFKKQESILKNAESEDSSKFLEELLSDLNKIKDEVLDEEQDKLEAIKKALKKALVSEFYGEITPKHSKNSASVIELAEGENKLLDFSITNNEVKKLEVQDDRLSFEDVTFIETPIFMQMYDVISQAETLFELSNQKGRIYGKPKVALHTKDLVSKLQEAQYHSILNDDSPLDISTIIHGNFEFSREEKDFIFSKRVSDKQTIKIKSANTASGIKSFGMLQLLLQAKIVDKKSLLIIDEPETHLHPEWQVKYAQVIIEMVKIGIPVLITSHSPYMIQALKYYSGKANLGNKLKFYMSEKEEEWCKIEDVTDDLNKIFIKLAKPLQQLVWE